MEGYGVSMEKTMLQKKKGIFKKYTVKDIRKFPFVYLIVALPVIQIAIFFFYVNFSAIAMSFQDEYGKWSLESFNRVFEAFRTHSDKLNYDPWKMLGNSVTIWVIQNIFGFAVSILTSYILTRHMIGSKLFRLTFYLPGIVGAVVFSSVMKEMYMRGGVVFELIKNMGVDLPAQALKNGLLGADETAFVTLMWQIFILTIAGGNMIVARAYMKIPKEIFESCELEGCGLFRETFQIAVPCVWPTLSTLIIFSLCSILTADYSMYLYSDGSGKKGMVSIGFYFYRYQVAMSTAPDPQYLYGYVSAFGMLMTIITIPIVIVSKKILAKLQENVEF